MPGLNPQFAAKSYFRNRCSCPSTTYPSQLSPDAGGDSLTSAEFAQASDTVMDDIAAASIEGAHLAVDFACATARPARTRHVSRGVLEHLAQWPSSSGITEGFRRPQAPLAIALIDPRRDLCFACCHGCVTSLLQVGDRPRVVTRVVETALATTGP